METLRTSFLLDMAGACLFTIAAMLAIIFGRIEGAAAMAVICLTFGALAFVVSMFVTLAELNGLSSYWIVLIGLVCVLIAIFSGAAAVVSSL